MACTNGDVTIKIFFYRGDDYFVGPTRWVQHAHTNTSTNERERESMMTGACRVGTFREIEKMKKKKRKEEKTGG